MEKSSALGKWVNATAERRKLYAQERLIAEVGEAIESAMLSENMKRTELALRLGCSKANLTQLLSGGRNMTLRKLADIAGAVGYRVEVKLVENS